MGRYVRVNDEIVWKYVVAEQASEQNRIYLELNIGECRRHKDGDGDTLRLEKADIKKLNDYLDEEISIKFAFVSDEIRRMAEYAPDNFLKRKIVPITRRRVIKLWNQINKNLFPGGRMTLGTLEFTIREMIRGCIPDINFWSLVLAYVEYMEKHPDTYGFDFVGEY